ncbi:MAG TPA: glycosyltransferase [Pyrinomonadaceae bacterium]|jgi:glycosyltransferase involved in cell wall biosynthesis|nr:glycosyltransferase [Pyrinomonadaceae bacterium]
MYVISDLSVGGAEMMLYKLLAGTDLSRFEPVVVSLMRGGALRARVEALGVKVHTVGVSPKLPTPLDLWRLVRLTREIDPDLVVGWMYHSCLAVQLAGLFSKRNAAALWSIHYSVESLAEEKRLTAAVIRTCARLSRMPRRIIYVSRDGRAKHGPLGFSAENGCVIPNGVDADAFKPSAEARASARAELGLDDDATLVGMVSRYHPMKDHANFLRAAALLSEKHAGAHFVLVGRGADAGNAELRGLIDGLGLAERTHLLGERHDVPRLAAALDIFSLSSYCESFPNVIGEAMACGVPCVVTDVGDAAWIVGDTGRVVPTRDPRALAGAWAELVALGAEGRAALGGAALARACELFPVKSIVRRYETLYEAVLAERESAARAFEYHVTDAP